MKYLPILYFSLAGILLLGSCDLINPEEQVPAYVYVQPFSLQANPNIDAGSLDHRITHVFAYVGSEFLGIYSLPALIPVLLEGEQEVLLDPGIRENGVSITIGIYPFYERYQKTLDLSPGKIDTLSPVTRYRSNSKVHFIEDFESGLPIFSEDRDQNALTFLDVTTEEVFEGANSGFVRLDTLNAFFDAGTDRNQTFMLGEGGKVFLEVNYKTDIDVLFGLVEIDNTGQAFSYYDYGLLPRETWNKVYFNLTDLVTTTNAEEYQIAVTAGLPFQNGKFTLPEAFVYLDNIKLISF
ncbi:MAG: hypothetical protein IPH04_20700 [Saprospirales bacterium]|nr:hypothetical protein [Saprospirales bacterium]